MEEKQQEHDIIEHFIHEHPLTRIPNSVEEMSQVPWCLGCGRNFMHGDAVYGCNINCGYDGGLHEVCAEMAREIRHPVHPFHPLTQMEYAYVGIDTVCAVCDFHEWCGLVYICSQGCKLWIHLGCTGCHASPDDNQVMNHPSHPQHQLRLWRRKERSFAFECDACGTTEKGNSYVCTICLYLIHESCALLPTTSHFHHHPQHSLSLAFLLPFEYIKYHYTCGICSETLPHTRWVYHCKLCRYVVHIKCAARTSHAATSNSIKNQNAADEEHKHILKCPTNDVYEEVIKPFVKRERGDIWIPHDDNQITTSYEFHCHKHPLRFTSFSLLPSSHDNNNEEDDDDDEDERFELTCDGCAMPIHQKPSTNCSSSPSSSSSSSSYSYSYSYDNGYMSCGECEYFLHLACFNLPQHLPSHPCHQIEDHVLNLQSCDRQTWLECDICYHLANGLFYACTKCSFQIDIKCISLPDTIKHSGHPHNDLKLITWHRAMLCVVCEVIDSRRFGYKCDKCTFVMCCGCAMLPASNKHRSEKHVLPLTYDASVNHPDDFYCASCETQMNPKSWMYHCRDCDQSFHPECIPATSGWFRNFNFGRQLYQVSHHPKHPLRLQFISKKKYCDVCLARVYDRPGYQCTSCSFVLCPWRHKQDVKPIDPQD